MSFIATLDSPSLYQVRVLSRQLVLLLDVVILVFHQERAVIFALSFSRCALLDFADQEANDFLLLGL